MKCPRCGNELKDGMLFCEHCGEEIRIVQDFEPEMEMNMETFSTETFSVEEDFPMDEILSDRMESARPKDAGGSMKAPGTEPFLKGKIRIAMKGGFQFLQFCQCSQNSQIPDSSIASQIQPYQG